MTEAYPLHWPEGFPRAKSRITSQFRTSLSGALTNVQDELRRFAKDTGRKIDNVVISSNVTLGQQRPPDPGVAIYYEWDGVQVCIPVDRYQKVEDNLQAIFRIIEADRTKMRHGGLNIVKASMRGYAALPPPGPGRGAIGQMPWWKRLGVAKTCTIEEAQAAYYAKVKTTHPDHGGDAAEFNLVVTAWEEARRELAA